MDSMHFPVGKFSNKLSGYIQLDAPSSDNFKAQFIHCAENFDLIIPTCEEIFHILPLSPKVLGAAQIYRLHSKLNFNRMSFPGWSGCMPHTSYKHRREITDTKNYVYKPEYTRFGSEVHICPEHLVVDDAYWLEQEYIQGTEICSYVLAYEGEVLEHSFYTPKHRSGKAGIYFQWQDNPELLTCIKEFVSHYRLHGQVSFDVIKRHGKYYFLECNPRMTSGIHNIAHSHLRQYINKILSLPCTNQRVPRNTQPQMLSVLNVGKEGWSKARDIIFSPDDMTPAIGQILSSLEVMYRSWKYRLSLVDSTVFDISWPLKN